MTTDTAKVRESYVRAQTLDLLLNLLPAVKVSDERLNEYRAAFGAEFDAWLGQQPHSEGA